MHFDQVIVPLALPLAQMNAKKIIEIFLCERVVNVWVPHQEGVILKELIGKEKAGTYYAKKTF